MRTVGVFRCVFERTMSRKSDALGTGAIAFSPLVDILVGWSFRSRAISDVQDQAQPKRSGRGRTSGTKLRASPACRTPAFPKFGLHNAQITRQAQASAGLEKLHSHPASRRRRSGRRGTTPYSKYARAATCSTSGDNLARYQSKHSEVIASSNKRKHA